MSEQKRRRATIVDVAAHAGTSYATVSRYLTGASYVAPATRKAIEAAIQAVQYVPNPRARALVQQRSQTIAFVVRERHEVFFHDPVLLGQASGANRALSSAGYQMLMMIVDSDASEERIGRLVGGGLVDGALLAAMNTGDPLVATLVSAGIPLVASATPTVDADYPCIDVDNPAATRDITRRLLATGRQHVAEILGPSDAPVSALRHDGFVAAMGDAFDANLTETAAHWDPESGATAMRALLARAPHLDGVVAASDTLAAGAIDVLQQAGRRVPTDVGVVGGP
ncbi:LacI family DNA-binding transcriptional regulator [uncultured Microbacterium sp.]|uniref:LacI family DNA-binding transcriptional regulator n=1 Tax=uncultured Microbacterium sp. TaxID=191216 RepID=UPI002634CAE7|nr:LacI family DNA-binding transcriptional regulator [uncultured Microbacterium sp.]